MSTKTNIYKNYELKFGRDTAPYRVFATWNIHYACNYKCTYCHAPKPQNKDVKKAAYLSVHEWLSIWERMYERYGTWEILISGGEPFAYPDFLQLLKGLSRIHLVSVCTNLEWDADYFIKHIDHKRVRIETSFHPESAKLDEFVRKLKVLKKNGFEPTVNFVPWPPLLPEMKKVKESVEDAGCQLTLQPFIGNFENRSYPQGYTEDERRYFDIFGDECNLKTLEFKTTTESDSTKGKLCRMGQNYCFIHPDGDASRCCRDHTISLGNIIDGSFKLLEEPVGCQAQNCNCWRCMLVDKEDFWMKNWGKAEITDSAIREKHKVVIEPRRRVSLIQPPVWGVYGPPQALAQLSGCLKKRPYEVSVFDVNIELYSKRREEYNTVWAIEQSAFWANRENVKKFFNENKDSIEETVEKIVASKPDVLCFSVNVCSLPATIELAGMIKDRLAGVRVVVGGPMFFVPFDAGEILKYDCIDVIVFGEGEETFCELLDFFAQEKDLSSCKGIYFKREGRIIKTGERPQIKDLDTLPFLDLEKFPKDKYEPPGHLGRHISLMTSRGCVFRCAYCGPKAYWPGFRFMSGRRIYEEVSYHLKCNPDIEHIEFLDLELNGNVRSLAEFCALMIANPVKENIRWHANIIIRPEMTKELLLEMKKAGCQHLSIGIETGSQRILDLMKKGYKIKDADNVLKNAYEAGIHVTTNFMFGFPQETEEDFNLTLEFLRRNAAFIGTVYPSRSFFTIEPFSYIAEHMDEFGIVGNPENNLYWESLDGKNNYPERLRRCEEFSKLACELGVSIGLGLQTSLELDRYYNLGFYYEAKKDFKKARHFFKEYIKLDPKNTVVSKKLLDSKDGLSQDNRKVSFNWDINAVCNYRCPYCWFFGKWAEMRNKDTGLSASCLLDFWERMFDSHGSIKVSITGGEPFLYPGFADLISAISKWHEVEIITNLSCSVKDLISKVSADKVKIHPSFHPLFANFEEFVDKMILLKEEGFTKSASYVAWPSQLPLLEYYSGKFKTYGIEIFVQPFFGEYNGNKYPDGYTEAEREKIASYLGMRGGKSFETRIFPAKGRLCYAGCLYGVIHPNGDVLRCGGLESKDAKVGNITDENFKLLADASVCKSEVCPCNEWAFLLKDEKDI